MSRISRLLLCAVLFVCLCYGNVYANTTPPCPTGAHEFESHIIVMNSEDTEGQVENTCIHCGYTYLEILPATGHHYGEWLAEGDVTDDGMQLERRECTNCHRSEERMVPATVEEADDIEEPVQKKSELNTADGVLATSICSIWGYTAYTLWNNGKVLRWYKKECQKIRRRRR